MLSTQTGAPTPGASECVQRREKEGAPEPVRSLLPALSEAVRGLLSPGPSGSVARL